MNSFQERLYEHHSQVFSVDAVLHRSRTGFQEALVFENGFFGRVLVLDGAVQLTERDNHIYHEMIAHVPLMAHGSAKRVLIIGGGDGGTLKEVLKHPIDEAVLVEIDSAVIDLSRRFFPDVSGNAFDDRRAKLVVADGVKYVAETDASFDVIIVDSTDPIGPGEQLFTHGFYRCCRNLLRPGGVVTVQSGAPFYQGRQLRGVCDRLACSFAAVRPFLAPVPTYAGGMLALVAAGPTPHAVWPPARVLRERYELLQPHTRYYTPQVHRAAFVIPPVFTASEAPETEPECSTMGGEASSPTP
jgi:spermidine synthase